MIVPMMLIEDLLRERVVLGEGFIVTMLVAAAIRAGLGLERLRLALDVHAEALEHVFEHRIGFELQIVRADFDRRMPVAEMIGRARERSARLGARTISTSCAAATTRTKRAVVGDEHVAVAQHGAARHHERDLLAVVERRGEPALAARVEGKSQGRARA